MDECSVIRLHAHHAEAIDPQTLLILLELIVPNQFPPSKFHGDAGGCDAFNPQNCS
jgi:hypothetical protein